MDATLLAALAERAERDHGRTSRTRSCESLGSDPSSHPRLRRLKVHDAARKHGIDPADAVHAAERAAFVADLDEDSPARQLRLGFDVSGRLLEVVVLRFDSGNELLIQAMKTRRQYLDLLD